MVALLAGDSGRDVDQAAQALRQGHLVLAPVSVTELFSDRELPSIIETSILSVPQLGIIPGYWERAGRLRAMLMRHQHRPKIADTLIAQSCLDHQVPLITRDRDFLAFQKYAGLKLL